MDLCARLVNARACRENQLDQQIVAIGEVSVDAGP